MDTLFATPDAFAPSASLVPRQTAVQPAAPSAPNTPRMDLYVFIHKALRGFMMDTLHRVGRMDTTDRADMAEALDQADALLTFCAGHLAHENQFVHAAIEARQPAGASRTAHDHIEHLESIETLRAETLALRLAPEAERMTLSLRLYRHLALFVAENFQHMHIEETANNAALWAHYSDAELAAIHGALVASIPPAEQLIVARWMLPALSPFERGIVVGEMKREAPPEAFLGMLSHVRPHLDDIGWRKLASTVGVAPEWGPQGQRP